MNATETTNYRRVIIIDDNAAIHDDFRKILSANDGDVDVSRATEDFLGEAITRSISANVDLSHASQGEEGLAICKNAVEIGKPFAVAFVDMRMPPGWDGLKTITALWQVDPNLQVVICSAHSDHSWTNIHRKFGITDRLLILKKPFDNVEVLQLTSALIEKRRLMDLSNSRTEKLEAIVEKRTRRLCDAKRETDLLISAIDSMLVGLDADGRVNLWNLRSETMFGVSNADAIGQVFTDLPIDWEDANQIKHGVNTQAKRFQAVFHNLSGEYRIVGMSSFQISDNGVYKGNLIIGTDLTDNRALESQLHQAQKLEAVGQLAAGVAHEINTPMQYIGDNLDFLKKKVGLLIPLMHDLENLIDLKDEERAAKLSAIQAAAKKLKAKRFAGDLFDAITDSRDGVRHVSQIVRAMKEFAHPGQAEKMLVDVNKALTSTIAVSTNEWKYVANINTDFDESNPLVSAFPVELNQVFLNILVNAAHAVSEGTEEGENGKGEISVATKLLDDCVRVSISDSGTGIPDDIKTRIFDPFFTTKEVGKGTGQGLSIAHSVVVNKHCGRLVCDSVLGEGTTFTIEIPLESDEPKDAQSQTEMVTIT